MVHRPPRPTPVRLRRSRSLGAALRRHRLRLRRSRLARRLERRRLGAWAAALLVGSAVAFRIDAADEVRAAWGATRPVVVATVSLRAGDRVGTTTATVEQLPSRVVPDGALHELPAGRRVGSAVEPGEVLTAARLAPDGLGATAAALPPGTAAVTVPSGDAPAPVRAGDVVDVHRVTVLDPYAAQDGVSASGSDSDGDAGGIVADRAVVTSVDATRTTLAVRRSQVVATVRAATAGGGVQLVIVG